MRFQKILLCIILSLSLITSLATGICALDVTSATKAYDQYVMQCLPDLISSISCASSQYGICSTDIDNISISSAFTISGGNNNALYYALMSNNKVLGIFTASSKNGKFNLTYAKDFADLLTRLYSSNLPFSLSWDFNNNISSLSVKTPSTTSSSISLSLNKRLCFYNSTFATNLLRNTSLSGELTNNFPLIYQDFSTYGFSCSVACAKAMAQYFDSSLSLKSLGDVIEEVYGYQEISMAPYFLPLERAPEVFDEYVTNSYLKFGYGLSIQGMKNQINANNPTMCIAESPDYEYSYHATVITGYSYGSASSSYRITMMDPYTPSWRIVFWDGTDDLTYSFNGNEKVWRKTIVLYS